MEKKKQFLTVQVLKLKVTDAGVELGTKGSMVAIATLIPCIALGWFGWQFLSASLHSQGGMQLLASSLLGLLAGWSIFLVLHVRRMQSMTRVLLWVGVVGVMTGMLAFEAFR